MVNEDAVLIEGLLAKRGLIRQEVTDLRQRIEDLKQDIDALDHVLDSLGYDAAEPDTPKRQAQRTFYRGGLARRCHAIIRLSGPITSRAIALQIMEESGDDPEDSEQVTILKDNVARCLRAQRDKGHVMSIAGAGSALLWEKVR